MRKATAEELAKIDDEYLRALALANHMDRLLAVKGFLIEWDEFYANQQLKEAQAAAKKEQEDAAVRDAMASMLESYEAKKGSSRG